MKIPNENSQNIGKNIHYGFKNIVLWNIVAKLVGSGETFKMKFQDV